MTTNGYVSPLPEETPSLTSIGGGVGAYAVESEDQNYGNFCIAGLNYETTEIGNAANSTDFNPLVAEDSTLVPVAEGVGIRVFNVPDPTVGGHQGIANILTYRTGIRESRWLEQEFNGQTMALPMTGVNPPGVVGLDPLMGTTVILGSNAALAGDPGQTPQQNMELYSQGLPIGGGDPNYG